MALISLSIEHFRNLAPVSLQFSPQLNLFIGENAAGKTSVLEALYTLARARSFRTRKLSNVIQQGAPCFKLIGRIRSSHGLTIPVGLQRDPKRLVARINGQPVNRLSELAALFPVQWFGGNLHQLIEEGPVYRRQFLDWGLFHVKPAYASSWKRFHKLLKQRNSALRSGVAIQELRAWDHDLAISAEQLHQFRQQYVSSLGERLRPLCRELLNIKEDLEIFYYRGWSSESSFQRVLEVELSRDREYRYTGSGPQRADLTFTFRKRPAPEQLSRGQQKLFVLALQLAQAIVLREETGQTSVFLMDDLGAELDQENQLRVMRLLRSIEAQSFITAIDEPGAVDWTTGTISRFHVKHGFVSKVL